MTTPIERLQAAARKITGAQLAQQQAAKDLAASLPGKPQAPAETPPAPGAQAGT
jgi:hypothetical protein